MIIASDDPRLHLNKHAKMKRLDEAYINQTIKRYTFFIFNDKMASPQNQ